MNFLEEIKSLQSQLSAIEERSSQLRGELSSLLNQATEAERRRKEAESIMAAAAAMMTEAQAKKREADELLASMQSKISDFKSEPEMAQDKCSKIFDEPKAEVREEPKMEVAETSRIEEKAETQTGPQAETTSAAKEEANTEYEVAAKPVPGTDLSTGMPVSDIRKAISIGDRFLFQRELFAGNGELMNKTIDALNAKSSMDEAMVYVSEHFVWDKESQAYSLFVNVLKRRF